MTWLGIWHAIKCIMRFVRGRSTEPHPTAATPDPMPNGAGDAGAACAACAACGADQSSAPPLVPASVPTILLALLNRERMLRQVPRCNLDPQLTAAAEGHCETMAEASHCSHAVGDEPCLQDRVLGTGFVFRRVGELVAEGQDTALDAIRDWLSDDASRKVLLDPNCSQVGFGLAVTPAGTHFWTAILADTLMARGPSETDSVLLPPAVVRRGARS